MAPSPHTPLVKPPCLYFLGSRRPKLSTHALTPPLTAAAYTRSGQHRVARQLSDPAPLAIQDIILCQTPPLGTPYSSFPHHSPSWFIASFRQLLCHRQPERRTDKNFPVFPPPTDHNLAPTSHQRSILSHPPIRLKVPGRAYRVSSAPPGEPLCRRARLANCQQPYLPPR